MKRIIISLLAFVAVAAAPASLSAQDFEKFDREQHMLSVLGQDSTTKAGPKKFKSVHMLGVKYSYNFSGVNFNPAITNSYVRMPRNLAVTYTYLNDMWDMLNNFGIQAGLRYCEEGFDAEYIDSERFKLAEFSLLSQFHIDASSHFRILLNLGPYAGYRLANGREDGLWDSNDNRFDYGLIANAGVGLVFNPFEIWIEGGYKFALSSLYHVNKISDEYWLFATPSNIMASISLHVHLW